MRPPLAIAAVVDLASTCAGVAFAHESQLLEDALFDPV
jgi:hypothetical protein